MRNARDVLRCIAALALSVVTGSCAGQAAGHSDVGSTAERCNVPLAQAITVVNVPNNPFQALPSADGCWVFVSMPTGPQGRSGAIAVLRRADGRLRLAHVAHIDASPTGMALTHDGSMLIVAGGPRIAFLDVARLIDGSSVVAEGYLDEPDIARIGRIYASVTRDDRFAFVADENAQTVTVIDLAKARASHFARSAIVGKIPTGIAPIAVTLSPDESLLYVTSQAAPPTLRWPIACKREGVADTTLVNPPGAIHVVDVARAEVDPAHAIVASVPAGCNTVRLVLSPTGDRTYVTARNSNALLAFDTRKLRDDPAHALIGFVHVGTAPVGVAVIDSGRKVVVTNSNRFAGGRDDRQYLTVVDATRIGDGDAAVIGSIAAGGFPRELRVTSDGSTLLLTNFSSSSVQAVDLTRLPLDAPRR
jgi:DNA-binding beta-propeller fold protein YncE